MTEAQVNEYRLRREITVEGKDVPKPVKSFSDAAFPGTTHALHFNLESHYMDHY